MNDDTTNKVEVEVPLVYDAKQNAAQALLYGLRKSIEHLFQSYENHISRDNPKITVKAPDIVVEHTQVPSESVYEDSNIDASEEE